jgi:hypothetical protein
MGAIANCTECGVLSMWDRTIPKATVTRAKRKITKLRQPYPERNLKRVQIFILARKMIMMWHLLDMETV